MQGTLGFEVLCLLQMMSTRQDLYLLMLTYSNHKDHLGATDLLRFLEVEQGEDWQEPGSLVGVASPQPPRAFETVHSVGEEWAPAWHLRPYTGLAQALIGHPCASRWGRRTAQL